MLLLIIYTRVLKVLKEILGQTTSNYSVLYCICLCKRQVSPSFITPSLICLTSAWPGDSLLAEMCSSFLVTKFTCNKAFVFHWFCDLYIALYNTTAYPLQRSELCCFTTYSTEPCSITSDVFSYLFLETFTFWGIQVHVWFSLPSVNNRKHDTVWSSSATSMNSNTLSTHW
jgi:hypothetical protein